MLARLQQLTTTGLALAALLWALYFIQYDKPGWAIAGAMLIIFGYAVFLALEFVLLWFVNFQDGGTVRATPMQLIGAWWGEVTTAPRVFCWRQPFRSDAEADHLPAGGGRRGVVLVHGFACNRAFWNPWMPKLRECGVPFLAINLEPIFGSIDAYTPLIDNAVRRLKLATGMAPVVVAHSMGGLAVRAWLTTYESDAHVQRVVTIGTPHRGTLLGCWALTPNTRQMALSSWWQRQLEARESSERRSRFTCFYSNCDNVVLPTSAGKLPDADNRHVPGVAHVYMAQHEQIFNEVLRWVDCHDDAADGTPVPPLIES